MKSGKEITKPCGQSLESVVLTAVTDDKEEHISSFWNSKKRLDDNYDINLRVVSFYLLFNLHLTHLPYPEVLSVYRFVLSAFLCRRANLPLDTFLARSTFPSAMPGVPLSVLRMETLLYG